MPDMGPHIDRLKPGRLRHEMKRTDADPAEHRIDKSRSGIHKLQHQAHQHDQRDEIRRVCNHLDGILESPVPYIIQSKRQHNGKRKTGDQCVQADGERILQQSPEFMRLKETFELGKSYPRTSVDPLRDVELFKRNLRAVHRHILENNDVQQREQKKGIQLPATDETLPATQRLPLQSSKDSSRVRSVIGVYTAGWICVNLHVSGPLFRILEWAVIHQSGTTHFFRLSMFSFTLKASILGSTNAIYPFERTAEGIE